VFVVINIDVDCVLQKLYMPVNQI